MAATRVQLKHILCPTDFSEFSARALRHAVSMARRFEATLTVLHVTPLAVAYGGDMPYFPSAPLALNPSSRKDTEAELREFVQATLLDRVQVNLEVTAGDPWREIRSMADALPADLLVMGTHGRGGFERFILGSVTEKVLRSVACPVLTVSHEEGRTWQAPGLISRILCATDLSESSAHTIAFALSLAAENQAHVTFLNVVESAPELALSAYAPPFEVGPPSYDLKQRAGQQLHDAITEEARAWCQVEERVEMGAAYKKILERAAEDRSDLIVMGSRGRGALGAMLFGSTSQHVVRAATCPVLSVWPRRSGEVAATASAGDAAERGFALR